MNKRQKEVLGASLDNEQEVLKALEKNYTKALADIKKNIKELQTMPQTQSKAYQIEFQKQLESQISAYLDVLKGNNFKSINEYYNKCYENGFIGSQYSLQGFGEGITIPIDQNEVVNALQMTCDGVKLSDKLGGDTEQLKKDVVSEMQRGFSTEMQYTDIARNISALGQASMARAMRIARTEGGRIQCKADLDCAYRAKELGCDTVKQWNATLDRKTRPSHQRVDKEWRELDEPFSNGLMYPKEPGGEPSEVINCRCSLDDVPRWSVEAGSAKYRRDNETGEIIECSNYAEFKEKYLNDKGRLDRINWNKVATSTDKEQFKRYKNILGKNAPQTLDEFCKIKYNGGSDYAILKHQYRDGNLQKKIRNDYILDIETGKQGKHIKGHNNYQQGKSYLNISMENAQMLVDKYAGTGEIQRDNSGKWKHTEIITKNKQNIGYVVSAVNGEEIETSFFKIHYSKNGTHIVPYARKEK